MICKHFGTCGGCSYLDIPYSDELKQKEMALRETLGSNGHLLEKIVPAPSPEGYRNKMELAFGDEGKNGKLALGIRKRRSFYEVASVENCILIPNDFREIAKIVHDYFTKAEEPFFHRKRHTGSLRHLVLRRGEFTGEVLLVFSTTSNLKAPLEPLLTTLTNQFANKLVGILHSVNDGVADVVKAENTKLLWGKDYYHEKICGLDFKVSAFSFFQTNSAGAEVLYNTVIKMAKTDKAKLAYDLYCGTGTIGLVLSPNFEKVIGVELNPEAIESARTNAERNQITNCDFIAGDVQLLLESKTPDVAIIDPPRNGLHPKALTKLIALSPPKLVYVSCKPSSLARDLISLTEAGYKPELAIGVDMFPRTPHIETVMLLNL